MENYVEKRNVIMERLNGLINDYIESHFEVVNNNKDLISMNVNRQARHIFNGILEDTNNYNKSLLEIDDSDIFDAFISSKSDIEINMCNIIKRK